MVGKLEMSCTSRAAAFARAVMALWRYIRFLALCGEQRQSRLKTRYGVLLIFPPPGGAIRRDGGYGFGQTCHGWVHFWRRADQSQA